MSANTARMEYLRAATFGSAAYDLDLVPGYEEQAIPRYKTREENAQRARENARERQRVRERANARARTHERPLKVSVTSVLGFAVVAVLVICMLLSYVQLTELSANMAELEAELAQLEKEEKRLTVDYEQAFNLSAVEAYAVNDLKMTRLADSQIVLVDIERGDKAEILASPESKGTDAVTGAVDFFTSLVSYFK